MFSLKRMSETLDAVTLPANTAVPFPVKLTFRLEFSSIAKTAVVALAGVVLTKAEVKSAEPFARISALVTLPC